MYSEYGPASGETKICSDQNILKLRFFGRTDLRISLSRAKFDEEGDFEVRSAVALQNSHQISEKPKFRSEIFTVFVFFCRRKMKRLESSETRFGKVSRRSEPCSRSYEKFFHLNRPTGINSTASYPTGAGCLATQNTSTRRDRWSPLNANEKNCRPRPLFIIC